MVGTKWKKKNYCRFDASFLCFVNPLREILEALPGYGTTAAARAALSIPIISVCSIFVCLSNGKAASVVVVFVCVFFVLFCFLTCAQIWMRAIVHGLGCTDTLRESVH